MKIRSVFIFALIFFMGGMHAQAQALTSEDLIAKIKSVVDIDLDQEDRLKPILEDYADSINKINDLVQKRVDRQVIGQKLYKSNTALDMKLKDIFTPDQMHLWDREKKVIYKEILTPADSQNQLQ